MIRLSSDNENSSDIGSVVLEKEPDLKHPPSYQVILINDDFTPMEFVVFVLQTVFGHTHQKSTEIMMTVHTKGKGVCGIYTKEVAETKSNQINNFAKQNEHPLVSDIEPIDEED